MHARLVVMANAVVATVAVAVVSGPGHAAAAPSPYCGTALSAQENRRIVALADPATLPIAPTFATLDELTSRQREIANILAAKRDWRGLFGVGMDGVIRDAVTPTQRNEAGLDDPRYTKSLSVDLAYTVAATRSTPRNALDFYRIVDSIAKNGNVIPERSKSIYNADLWGLWTFYFFGQGLDRIVGAGVASNLMLRAADDGYNTITFANGLALQDPAARPAAEAAIQALWQTGEIAFDVLSGLGGLGAPVTVTAPVPVTAPAPSRPARVA